MVKDTKLFALLEDEKQRQLHGIELIASENFVSEQVMQAMGSVLTNKYAEGYPGKRYYGGCQCVDVVESNWPSIVSVSSTVRSMPTFSPTRVHRPIWLCFLRC